MKIEKFGYVVEFAVTGSTLPPDEKGIGADMICYWYRINGGVWEHRPYEFDLAKRNEMEQTPSKERFIELLKELIKDRGYWERKRKSGIDLPKLEAELDAVLANETEESLTEFLNEQRRLGITENAWDNISQVKDMACPICNGKGKVEVIYYNIGYIGMPVGTIPTICYYCNGTGRVKAYYRKEPTTGDKG